MRGRLVVVLETLYTLPQPPLVHDVPRRGQEIGDFEIHQVLFIAITREHGSGRDDLLAIERHEVLREQIGEEVTDFQGICHIIGHVANHAVDVRDHEHLPPTFHLHLYLEDFVADWADLAYGALAEDGFGESVIDLYVLRTPGVHIHVHVVEVRVRCGKIHRGLSTLPRRIATVTSMISVVVVVVSGGWDTIKVMRHRHRQCIHLASIISSTSCSSFARSTSTLQKEGITRCS
mmetsp:Transcript_27718/g.51202  ORF Transcript_27718/g.51202 Transcript_27718/m.51202 type:complete len:233 (+) Transcript_27718:462-1160(+)